MNKKIALSFAAVIAFTAVLAYIGSGWAESRRQAGSPGVAGQETQVSPAASGCCGGGNFLSAGMQAIMAATGYSTSNEVAVPSSCSAGVGGGCCGASIAACSATQAEVECTAVAGEPSGCCPKADPVTCAAVAAEGGSPCGADAACAGCPLQKPSGGCPSGKVAADIQ
jgi:hypothetical protein